MLSNREISIALKAIDDQIAELQEQRNFISRSEFAFSEEEYHLLCHTELRHSISLGEEIGRKLGCKYIRREPNAFLCELPNGWELRVPTIDQNGVDIYLEMYYLDDIMQHHFHAAQKASLSEARASIRRIETEFFDGNLLSKAGVEFGSHFKETIVRKCFIVAVFLLSYPFKKYGQLYDKKLRSLYMHELFLQSKIKSFQMKWEKNLPKQKEAFAAYFPIIFSWTDEIRIHDKATTGMIIIRKEEFYADSERCEGA